MQTVQAEQQTQRELFRNGGVGCVGVVEDMELLQERFHVNRRRLVAGKQHRVMQAQGEAENDGWSRWIGSGKFAKPVEKRRGRGIIALFGGLKETFLCGPREAFLNSGADGVRLGKDRQFGIQYLPARGVGNRWVVECVEESARQELRYRR